LEVFSVKLQLLDRNTLNLEGGLLGLNFDAYQIGWTVVLPYWFLLCIAIAMATVPWIRWSKRFGLRTLLIATTLVAVALGSSSQLDRTSECGITDVVVALWPVILLVWAIAIAEAIERRGRFSVRSLLIAITLVAVALGVITVAS
jgi:hypothetical protein